MQLKKYIYTLKIIDSKVNKDGFAFVLRKFRFLFGYETIIIKEFKNEYYLLNFYQDLHLTHITHRMIREVYCKYKNINIENVICKPLKNNKVKIKVLD